MIEQRARLRGIAAQHLQDAAGLLAALEGPVEGATEVCPMPGVLMEWQAGNNAMTYTYLGILLNQAAESILNAQVPPQPDKEESGGEIEEVPEVRA